MKIDWKVLSHVIVGATIVMIGFMLYAKATAAPDVQVVEIDEQNG